MINWKVRLKNKHWVMAFISQIMIIAELLFSGLNTLGVTHFQLTGAMQNAILTFFNTIFVILSLLGIVQDPTTKGYGDSDQALNYNKPK